MAASLQSTSKFMVGYFPGLAIHARGYHVSDIPADKLTHINYAFAWVSNSGGCVSLSPQDDQINFPALQLLKQQHPGLRTLIAVGGASHSGNFSKATATAAARQSLAQSCVSFMRVSGFDGIDIDWEFPGPTDKPNYTALLKELRSQLDVQGVTDGTHYLLTAALSGSPDHFAHFELPQIAQYLDWINLMAYDFYTASSSKTHFSAPLYASSTDREPDPKKRSSSNVDASVRAYLSEGVPAGKIVVGLPFFGYGWEGVTNVNHGLYQATTGPAHGTWQHDGLFDFQDLKNNYVGTYLRFWSTEASAPWLYSPDTGIMINYDDAQSLGLKADYVNANKLGGVMIWQLSADDAQSSLVNALSARLNPPAPAPSPQPEASPVLTNATRSITKVTHVPLMVDTGGGTSDVATTEGLALIKFGYVRQLSLQPGEVDAVRTSVSSGASRRSEEFSATDSPWDLLTSFEGKPIPASLPPASEFAGIPGAILQSFGKALAALRKQAVAQISSSLPAPTGRPTAIGTYVESAAPMRVELRKQAVAQIGSSLPAATGQSAISTYVEPAPPVPTATQIDLGTAQHLLNLVAVANKGLDINIAATPIGMVNLERLEMAPAGIERGELIATIPLAPGERTAVVQKEWSVTTKEFTSIVTDSLENYSETGVTDNTELAQSTTSNLQHSNQFNITGTVSGGIPDIVTGSVTASFGAQDSLSQSATDSRNHAVALTQKASARTKKEHKVTISTTTVTGTSQSTTRELVNPSTTDPIRIDYFSMMRKWRVRLYRYGLRLTYDIVIPEPAGAMREAYAYLEWLRSQIGPFTFLVPHFPANYVKSKSDPNYAVILKLADQYNAQIPPFPEAPGPIIISALLQNDTDANAIRDESLPVINVPQGFWIENLLISIRLRNVGAALRVLFSGYPEKKCDRPEGNDFGPDDLTKFGFSDHATGNVVVRVSHHDCQNSGVQLEAVLSPTDQNINGWLNDVWNALYNAAQTQYYAQQQDIAGKIAQLEDQLNNVDTLTLRREESEEIMKGVLRYILGPGFDHLPQYVVDAIKSTGADIVHGVVFTGNEPVLTPLEWSVVRQYEDTVRFINQAIEWENVVSFLYSYFWDVSESWDFIRQIRHPDAARQAFLRAGSARVVLTVRKGWETAWAGFVDSGIPGGPSPYLTIAQEIAAYDDRNYPGIPPANPSQQSVRLEDSVYTTSSTKLNPPIGGKANVEIEVGSSKGFIVGEHVVIDSGVAEIYSPDNAGRQEKTTIIAIRDGTHITLAQVLYPHGSDDQPYAIVQPGEKGVLIAEWFEYTPTSGTDIAVTSNLATVA